MFATLIFNTVLTLGLKFSVFKFILVIKEFDESMQTLLIKYLRQNLNL